MTANAIAMRTLHAATRLRLRGRPWSWLANVVAAVAAGALSPEELRRGNAEAWEVRQEGDVAQPHLMDWERHLVDRVIPAGGRILVIGSGAGRDLVAFARLGFQVTGIEPAPIAARTSVDALRDRGLNGSVIHAFAEDAEITGVFDTVIFSYFCYAYIPCSARRVALLQTLRRNVADAGTIVVTYNPPRRMSLTPLIRFGAWLARSSWRPEAGDEVYLIGRATAPFAVEHLFRENEVVEEARRAGYHTGFQGPVGEVRLAVLRTTEREVSARGRGDDSPPSAPS